MKVTETLYVTNRNDWRVWLERNHKAKKEIWLIYYKKHIGKPTIPYDDAVEEAICFGWIDSTVRRIDDEKYMQRYTPRNSKSIWAESNRKRAAKMTKEGKMTEAGLKLIRAAKESGEWTNAYVADKDPEIPPDLKEALEAKKTAQKNFENFAPSHRKQYIFWVTSAKREETRKKRINKVVEQSAKNKKLMEM